MAGNKHSGNRGPRVDPMEKAKLQAALDEHKDNPVEWCRTAHSFSDLVDKVRLRKYVAASWSYIEDLDLFGPGFNLDELETYILRKHKDGRYRLEAIGNGVVLASCPAVFIGDWQGVPAPAISGQPLALTNGGPAKPLKDLLSERVEMSTALDMEARMRNDRVTQEMAPMRGMTEMMAGFLGLFGKIMETTAGAKGGDNTALILEQMRMNHEQSMKMIDLRIAESNKNGGNGLGGSISELGATLKTLKDVLGIEIGRGADEKTTTQMILETGVPIIREVVDGLRVIASAKGGGRPLAVGEEVPDVVGDLGGGAPMIDDELIELVVDLLKSKDWPGLNAVLANLPPRPDGRPALMIDPRVTPKVYVVMFGTLDARLKPLAAEIEAFILWMREEFIKAQELAKG